MIRAYRSVARSMLPVACRFQPSCSQYAEQAICRRGVVRGIRLACCRLARCHPFSRGGYDPVPGAE